MTTNLVRRSVRTAKLKMVRRCWQLYLLILPAIAYLILFNYIPMYGAQIAFKDFRTSKGIWGSEWAGLKYFIRFVEYPAFWQILGNTLRLSLYSLATFPLPVLLSLLINELQSRPFKRTVQMVTYAPHFMSTVVVCSMLTLFMSRSSGLFNNIGALFGMERTGWLEIPELFDDIYVWSDLWQHIGWSTIIYISALSGVSPEIVEAARIDGATRMQIIRHVNIPSILPTIVIMLILRSGSILSIGFEKVYLMQNSLNLEASQVISTYVYEMGLVSAQFSYSTAIGLFNTVVNVVALLLVNFIASRLSDISLW